MNIHLTRWTSTGNTFFILDLNDFPFEKIERPNLVKNLCQNIVGFQTDGFIFISYLKNNLDQKNKLKSEEPLDASWDFYNSDGSPADMCGNAARAVALFFEKFYNQNKIKLKTQIGNVDLQSKKDQAPSASWDLGQLGGKWDQVLSWNQISIEFDFLNTGVPHVVVESDPDYELAKHLRHDKEISMEGSNVTFVEHKAPGELEAVTFERGVEDFTLSCGTGAVAAALWSKQISPELLVHTIFMPGGQLEVKFIDDTRIELKGMVTHDFSMEVEV